MITFGICISPTTPPEYLTRQLVRLANYEFDFEVIIIGCTQWSVNSVVETFKNVLPINFIPFNDDLGSLPGHITKKKNIIAQQARYDRLCIMHDYYLSPIDFFDILYWWEEDEPIYCPQIKTLEGKRHSDWMVNPNHMKKFIERYDGVANKLMAAAPHENAPWFVNALPYNMNLSPIQYVSGGLMMLKTEVLLDIPMNENLRWGDAEDVEFSERAVAKYKLTRVRGDGCHFTLMKPNKWAVSVIPDDVLPLLEEYSIECQTTTS